jgi:hypothetical protein
MSNVLCAKCTKEFDWNDAYNQQSAPGAYMHNPPGVGDFRPRAFCPHCGFLVADWDIDRSKDRDRWKWYGENARVNANGELPPSPLSMWGQDIPPDARVEVPNDHIDVELVKRLLTKNGPDGAKSPGEKPTPDYSFVRVRGDVRGIWLREESSGHNRHLLISLILEEGLSEQIGVAVSAGKYRIVPNTYDASGGCFVMFESWPAPGEPDFQKSLTESPQRSSTTTRALPTHTTSLAWLLIVLLSGTLFAVLMFILFFRK